MMILDRETLLHTIGDPLIKIARLIEIDPLQRTSCHDRHIGSI